MQNKPMPARPSLQVVSNNVDQIIAHADWGEACDLPRRQFIYGHHLLLGTVSALIADGGIGKTTLALTEAVALATGRDLLGEQPKMAEGVLYWNGEEPREEIKRRVHAICQQHGIDPKELTPRRAQYGALMTLDMPLCLVRYGVHGLEFDSATFDRLADYIREHGITVLILDPFVACHQVPENENMRSTPWCGCWPGSRPI